MHEAGGRDDAGQVRNHPGDMYLGTQETCADPGRYTVDMWGCRGKAAWRGARLAGASQHPWRASELVTHTTRPTDGAQRGRRRQRDQRGQRGQRGQGHRRASTRPRPFRQPLPSPRSQFPPRSKLAPPECEVMAGKLSCACKLRTYLAWVGTARGRHRPYPLPPSPHGSPQICPWGDLESL